MDEQTTESKVALTDLPRAAIRAAGEAVWAWYLGVRVRGISIERGDTDAFVEYADELPTSSTLDLLHVASLSVAPSESERVLLESRSPDAVEDEVVRELIEDICHAGGAARDVHDALLSHLEQELRKHVRSRLRAPDMRVALDLLAASVARRRELDGRSVDAIMQLVVPLGASHHEMFFIGVFGRPRTWLHPGRS